MPDHMDGVLTVHEKLADARAVLAKVEWVDLMYVGRMSGYRLVFSGGPGCPYCGRHKDDGHIEGCKLKAALDQP